MNYKAKITKYLLCDSTPACYGVGYAISGSNDNPTFYTIDAQIVGMKINTMSPFDVSNNQYYYRYIRLTFTETVDCSCVSFGFFTIEGDLKKWKNAICAPFSKKGICMKHVLRCVIVCLR